MKKETYIVEIEMPDGDAASSVYISDVIQSACDVEDIGRWKVSVKEYLKPSEEQLNNILNVLSFDNCTPKRRELLKSLYDDLKKL